MRIYNCLYCQLLLVAFKSPGCDWPSQRCITFDSLIVTFPQTVTSSGGPTGLCGVSDFLYGCLNLFDLIRSCFPGQVPADLEHGYCYCMIASCPIRGCVGFLTKSLHYTITQYTSFVMKCYKRVKMKSLCKPTYSHLFSRISHAKEPLNK